MWQFPRMRSSICSHTDVRYAPRVLHFSAFHYCSTWYSYLQKLFLQIGTLENAYEFVLPLGKDQQSNNTGPLPQVTEALLQEESVRLELALILVLHNSY